MAAPHRPNAQLAAGSPSTSYAYVENPVRASRQWLTGLFAEIPGIPVRLIHMRVLQERNIPLNGDFHICGPSTFMSDLKPED
jgi:hypothetical protein